MPSWTEQVVISLIAFVFLLLVKSGNGFEFAVLIALANIYAAIPHQRKDD